MAEKLAAKICVQVLGRKIWGYKNAFVTGEEIFLPHKFFYLNKHMKKGLLPHDFLSFIPFVKEDWMLVLDSL